MANKDKPRAERKRPSKATDEDLAQKRAQRQEQKHHLKVIKRKSTRRG